MAEVETIVAPATPAGESALAVVRLSGPLARQIATTQRGGRAPLPRRIWHGDYTGVDGVVIDDVVFAFSPGPGSYTGDDVLEVSSHGNPYIVQRILADCLARGCRMAEAGEFTRRAFLNRRIDLTEAEAVMDVIHARSERALQIARRQLRGELGRRVDRLVADVLRSCAAIEAYIDFPEEDLPAEDRAQRRTELAAVAAEIRRLEATRRHGEMLKEGLRVVLAGAPNAGKSSLLNRLAGYDRAIVSEQPGTTRDFLEESLLLGPHRIRMIDTAGLRSAGDPVERAGVERSLDRVAEADLLVLVVDATLPCPTLPDAVRTRLAAPGALVAVNKCDLPDRSFTWAGNAPRQVEVSATTSAGMGAFRAALIEEADRLTGSGDDEERIAVNARHATALSEAGEALDRADRLLAEGAALELVGSELRVVMGALGAIVGRIDHESVLDVLFASFCIGK